MVPKVNKIIQHWQSALDHKGWKEG